MGVITLKIQALFCMLGPLKGARSKDGYRLLINDSWCYFGKHRKMCKATEKTVSPRLLTEEEYRIQGEVETRKALEELREYCNSPDCSAWKTISRIQSPKR